mmetsp:Transcript_74132/g.149373  ORF Transcript_74132/g.149373 Transcript_74132/m.149373 type:complete len:517 (-) Transcript_74132:320-1870(-)
MLYIRALPEDIQRWAMSDWTWSDVLAQYHALETGIGLSADTAYAHGTTGPMATSPPVLKDKLGHLFLQTSKKLGISQSDDFNAPGGREGAGIYQFNIRDGVRDSAAVTLLASSLLTMPVALRTQTMVEEMKLSVDEGDPTSWRVSELRGVDGSGHKWSLPISRGKKVVAAAGAINTPALLMRSRIGNANILNESDGLLPPLVPLPSVGQGLQDHPAVGLVFTVTPPLNADMVANYKYFSNWTTGHELDKRLSFGFPGFSTGAFLKSGLVDPDDPNADISTPDLQLTVFPIIIEPHIIKDVLDIEYDRVLVTVAVVSPKTRYQVKMTKDCEDCDQDGDDSGGGGYEHNKGEQRDGVCGLKGARCKGEQRGEKEARYSPEVVRGQLHPFDVQRLVKGARIVRAIFAEDPLNTYVTGEAVPGPSIQSDRDLAQWVTAAHTDNSHWCCSARMGMQPETSVVDGQLKVHGISNLYVADASLFPVIPNGNVHSTVIAIASLFGRRLANVIAEEMGSKTGHHF